MNLVVEHLGGNRDRIDPETSFLDDLGADSLDIVEIVMALEEEFGMALPDADVEHMGTVQDAIDYVERAQDDRRARGTTVRI